MASGIYMREGSSTTEDTESLGSLRQTEQTWLSRRLHGPEPWRVNVNPLSGRRGSQQSEDT
jgi:hypothetical protein